MNFEGPKKNAQLKEEIGQELTIVGVDKDGSFIYEPLTEKYGMRKDISDVVFDRIHEDFRNLQEINEPLKFNTGEYLKLAINSNKKALYEVGDAKKGHYFLVKGVAENEVAGDLTIELSNNPKVIPNPDIIVCSASELDSWFDR